MLVVEIKKLISLNTPLKLYSFEKYIDLVSIFENGRTADIIASSKMNSVTTLYMRNILKKLPVLLRASILIVHRMILRKNSTKNDE